MRALVNNCLTSCKMFTTSKQVAFLLRLVRKPGSFFKAKSIEKW